MARSRSSSSSPSSSRRAAPATATSTSTSTSKEKQSPRGAVPELDRIIHERMRLAIVSALAANESLSFRELKALLRTSDGNLSVHARKLEDAGYLACDKSFERRVPRTDYRLTPEGRRAFERYINHLEALVQSARRL
jgi:DNA-binding transcriptional ArsR family regulator